MAQLNIAVLEMGAPEWVDVFPLEHGDIPAIAMLVYWRVDPKN